MNKVWLLLATGILAAISMVIQESDLLGEIEQDMLPDLFESPQNSSIGANEGITRIQDTISIDYRDKDVREVLQSVADQYRINIVLPDHLRGKISIRLRDVSWSQVFDVVLEPMEYTWEEKGNIIRILRQSELLAEPTQTRVFIINYANAAELLTALRPLIDPSEGGHIHLDSRSNALVITEKPSKLGTILDMINRLDRPTVQMLIEAKVFEVLFEKVDGSKEVVEQQTEFPIESSPPPVFQRRLVAHPMVVTLNKHEAKISINERIPVQVNQSPEEEGGPGNIVSEYINIIGSLKVRPDVNSAGFIKLSIESEVTSFEGRQDINGQHRPNTHPLTITRRIESEVVVKSGYSLMIGGFQIAGDSGVSDLGLTDGEGSDAGRRSYVIILNAKVLNPDGADYRDVMDERFLHQFELLDRDIPGTRIPLEIREKLDEIRQLRSESRNRSEINSLDDLVEELKTESPTSSGRE